MREKAGKQECSNWAVSTLGRARATEALWGFLRLCPGALLAVSLTAGGLAAWPQAAPMQEKGQAVRSPSQTASIFRISDVHLDPFYGCHLTYSGTPSPAEVTTCTDVLQGLFDQQSHGWKTSPSAWEQAFQDLCSRKPAHPQCEAATYSSEGDTNYQVFHNAIESARTTFMQRGSQPDFTLYTGDFLGHDFDHNYNEYCSHVKTGVAGQDACGLALTKQFIDQTLDYITWKIKQAVNVTGYATLGNNDAYCGDYEIMTDQGFLKKTASTLAANWSSFPNAAQRGIFEKGGYYRVQMGPGARLLILNTTIYTEKYVQQSFHDYCPKPASLFDYSTFAVANDLSDPAKRSSLKNKLMTGTSPQGNVWMDTQFGWLVGELLDARANNEQVWVVAHVPPGRDPYSGDLFFARSQSQDFAALLGNAYLASSIAGYLCGHTHESEFKVVRESGGQSALGFVLLAPGIDGDHGHNSSYQVFEYDPAKLEILNYWTFYDNGGTWTTWKNGGGLKSFRDAYGAAIAARSGSSGPFPKPSDIVVNTQALDLLFQAMDCDSGNTRTEYARQYYSLKSDSINWCQQRPAIASILNHVKQSSCSPSVPPCQPLLRPSSDK
ncbi:MAG TPA: hypothetical protein VLV83_18275 [Acidobacteriota bacterium]|nr:hypothetical protein [Acidobacteriota bacterium]